MTGKPLGSVLIGVCGSSAAVDTDLLVEQALRYADRVTVVASRTAAARFLPPLTVPCYTDDDWTDEPLHVTLVDQADTFVVAPATATTLAKASVGIADTLVTALISVHGPGIFFAPCMNVRMWSGPPIRRAVQTLRADGHHVLEPGPMTSRSSPVLGTGVGEIPGAVMDLVAEQVLAGAQPGR